MLWTTQSYRWYEQIGILWVEAFRFYEQHKAKDDTNDSLSWAYDPKGNEQLRAMDDMNYSKSWAQGSRCYEKLKVVVGVKEFESCA